MSIVLRMLARRVFVLGLAVVALFVVLASFAAPSRAEQMVASWYGVGDGFAGLTTANGETFDPYAYTAAHKTLPFDTKLRVTYQGESVVVRINDRGPYIQGRDLDLSYIAARDIGLVAAGSAPVEVEYVDPSTPVGPVQTTSASSTPAPEPAPEPAQEPAPEPEPAVEPAPTEEAPLQASQEPDTAPQVSSEGAPEESSVALAQYPIEEQAADDQYADAEQYENRDAAGDQYGVTVSGEPVAEPSGEPTPAAEFAPQQVEAETEQVEEAPEQPSPATVVPPVEDLEEPPEEFVEPGTTVEHRVELSIAAAPGTTTDSPEAPDVAPEPVEEPTDDVLVSGAVSGSPGEPANVEQAPEATEVEPAAEAPEEGLPGADEKLQEVKIEVLPDTGGWVELPRVSLTDLVAVLLVATVLRSGLRRLRT